MLLLIVIQIEAFLASLSERNPASKNPGHSQTDSNARQLSREATAALKDAGPYMKDSRDISGGQSEAGVEDLETEEEILARALEEAKLVRTSSPNTPGSPGSSEGDRVSSSPKQGGSDDDNHDFAFPGLPNHLPTAPAEEDDDKSTRAMMSRLLGLSGPSQAPSAKLPSPLKREVGKGWTLPGYDDTRDDDMDSWCCESPSSLSSSSE